MNLEKLKQPTFFNEAVPYICVECILEMRQKPNTVILMIPIITRFEKIRKYFYSYQICPWYQRIDKVFDLML